MKCTLSVNKCSMMKLCQIISSEKILNTINSDKWFIGIGSALEPHSAINGYDLFLKQFLAASSGSLFIAFQQLPVAVASIIMSVKIMLLIKLLIIIITNGLFTYADEGKCRLSDGGGWWWNNGRSVWNLNLFKCTATHPIDLRLNCGEREQGRHWVWG